MRRAVRLTTLSLLLCALPSAASAQDEPEPPEGAPAADGPRPDPTAPGAPAPEAPEPERSAEDVARRAGVIARIGEVEITVGEVEDAINEQSPFVRVRYRDRAELQNFVQSMIRFELLARAADRAEIDALPEVQRAVKQNAVQQLIRRDFDERITVDSIPDSDVQAYFDSHPEEFNSPELRRAAHIRFTSREAAMEVMPAAREADARAFRALAREHSGDPATSLRGGDLRYFEEDGRPRNARDPMVEESLARAAFALAEIGDLSPEPIHFGEFWSILKLTGRRPAEHRSLTQSAPTIRLRIWRQRRQDALEQFVADLRERAHVGEVPYDLLRGIQLDPPEREDQPVAPHGAPPPATLEEVQE